MTKLDPRLRRLLLSKCHCDSIGAGVWAGFLECDPALKHEERRQDNTYARVLLKVSEPRPAWLEERPPDVRRCTHIAGDYYTAEIRLSLLEQIADDPVIQYMETARLVSPMLDDSVRAIHADDMGALGIPERSDAGAGVVIGIVDYGIDYTLKDFQDGNGKTRIAYLWDQALEPNAEEGEHSPENYGYGVEYDDATINDALGLADPFSKVRHNPRVCGSDVAGHGTHVAGIAAGNGRTHDDRFEAGKYVGVAPGATIVFVHLERKQTLESIRGRATLSDSVQLVEGIAYCFEKARAVDKPCVVNLSMGFNGGSHDGHSPVEEIIDLLLADTKGRAVVIAAGNQHSPKGVHVSGDFGDEHSPRLSWKMGRDFPLIGNPDRHDPTPNEMEIWYSSARRCGVRVHHPDNSVSPLVDVGEEKEHPYPNGETVFIDSKPNMPLNHEVARIYIRVEPPKLELPDRGEIRAGNWQVELIPDGRGRFDAWIEKEIVPQGEEGRQSEFSDYDASKALGTLTTPATARLAIAAANYNDASDTINPSSGRGPTRDGQKKPDVAAPGVGIISSNALAGRQVNGLVLPAREARSGTSMSAPHVAGVVALLLQREQNLTAKDISEILTTSATKLPTIPFDATGYNPASGYGKVNAQAAMAELERRLRDRR